MRTNFPAATLLFALAFCFASVSRAQFITPTGYAYSVAPNDSFGNSYPDSGSELTDGTLGLSFSHYSSAPEAVPWVGWSGIVPTVSFQFGSAQTFSRIEIGTARHDGASVGLPQSITISGTTFNFTSGAFADNTRDWLVLDGSFATTLVGGIPTLEINFGSSHSQWLMLDEVRFTAIPEPAETAAIVSVVLGTVLLVRRRVKPHAI